MRSSGPGACFFERDPRVALGRRAMAEGVGTFLLMLAATGSGLAAARLAPGAAPVALMLSAAAIPAALVGLIIALGEVSGGHLNPLITGLQYLAGERPLDCTLAYVLAQCAGAIAGAIVAGALFGVPVGVPGPSIATWSGFLSELVASAGLMIIVLGCTRSGRKDAGPFAVGAWLFAAIVATPSTSYANPAIALAALFAEGPIALTSQRVLSYLPAEVVGALMAFLMISLVYPRRRAGSAASASAQPGSVL